VDYNYNFNPVQNTFFLGGLNPPFWLHSPTMVGRSVSFSICGTAGATYQIQSASSLGAGDQWQSAGSVTLTNAIQSWSDPALLANSSRFYRLVQINP
jgi:hypothetical protein